MKIAFACPGCGCSGSVDESLAGRQIRCKQCNHRFPVPHPEGAEDDAYALQEPARGTAGVAASSPPAEAVFVPARSHEPSIVLSPRKPRRTKSRKSRDDGPGFPRHKWLIGAGVAFVVTLGVIALALPNGVEITGSILVLLGSLMVLVGWAAGLYGAWSEDFLYAFLYFFIPLYSAYYLVTRWDDLWRWFACSTAGVGLAMIGSQMLQSVGFGE